MKNTIFFLSLILFSFSSIGQTGCPSLEAGPAPTFSTGDTTICAPTTLTLTANVFHVGYTDTYTVSSIPYAPPYPFTSGVAIPLSIDDAFGPVVTLPFQFCFFGQSYTQLVVGANGIISFDLTNANQSCAWSYTASLPSTSLFRNAIFGAYHDIDPSVCGSFRYGVVGSYPCRAFIMNFDHICQFSCNSLQSTLQVVLYEGTNVIEVHILNKPTCSSWNGGRCVIGIQNSAGTTAFVPPGRNTGSWSTSNEAWRFTPNGIPSYTISWFNNSTILGYNAQENVYVDHPDSFIAIAAYDFCDGTQLIFRDTVHVYMNTQDVAISTSDSVLCLGESTTLTAAGGDSFVWSDGSTNISTTVSPTSSGYYSVTGTYMGTCYATDSIYITVNQPPAILLDASPPAVCMGDSASLIAQGGVFYSWNSLPDTVGSVIVAPLSTTTYSVTGTDTNGCSNNAQVTLTVNDLPTITLHASPEDGCEDLFVQFYADVTPPAAVYNWSFSDGVTSTSATPTRTFSIPGKYDATLDAITADGCEDKKTESSIVDVYELPVSNFIADTPSVTMDNPVVNFVDMSTLAANYFWVFGDYSSTSNYSNEANPSHTFSGPGDYIVWQTVYSQDGCSDSSYTVVHVELNMAFYIPNAFSPFNEDGINDVFQPYGIGIGLEEGTYSMLIFNRWGRLVFQSDDIDYGWNGKIDGSMAAPGVYSYRIEVKFGDGLWHVYNGKITLIE